MKTRRSLTPFLFLAAAFCSTAAYAQPYPCILTDPAPTGDARSDAQLTCDDPPPCGGLATVTGVRVRNTGSRWIETTIAVRAIDERGTPGDPPSGDPPPKVVRTLAPGQTSALIGCSGRVSYIDINNPRAWILQYRVDEAHVVPDPTSGTAGGYNACLAEPAVKGRGDAALTVGTYRPQAAANFKGIRENGQWIQRFGPVCIGVYRYDQIVEAQCPAISKAIQYIFSAPDPDGFYSIREASTGHLLQLKDMDGSRSKLRIAESDGDVYGSNCRSAIDQTRWNVRRNGNYYQIQNKQTGSCIDATADDGTNREGTEMQTLGCASVPQQLWTMVPIAVAPGLGAAQISFLRTRTPGPPRPGRTEPPRNVPRPPRPDAKGR